MCAVVWCYAGPDEAEAAKLLEPARKLSPILDGVGPVPLPGIQSAFDGVYPHGDQWYWRADYVREIPPAAVQANVEHALQLPTWKSAMHMYPTDGAAARVGSSETPWRYRDARWAQVIVGVDPDPANAALIRDWTVSLLGSAPPLLDGRRLRQLHDGRGPGPGSSDLRANYERLAAIKAKYDPENLFHVNQNIRPS